jgi:alpha-tubulin suppressor-like RCC1 family protein
VPEALTRILPDVKVESIACGAEHSFAVAADTGDLYAWGLNFKGQLGLADYDNRQEPTLVPLSANAKQFTENSARASKALFEPSKKGDLFTLRPKERVLQVACGAVHTMFRTSIDRVFSCGNGSTFALGHGNRDTLTQFK